jgi:hypothetical protein
MAAEKVVFSVNLSATISEVLAAAIVPASDTEEQRTVKHVKWNVDQTFLPTSTPDPERCLSLEITLDSGGLYDLDLTAAPTTGAPAAGEDLTGLKVMYAEFTTPADNAAAILLCDQAATNEYDLLGAANELDLVPGSKLCLLHTDSALPAVAGTDKIIRFSGTEGDVLQIKLVFE